jgi:preprotein translocase SecE subunit
MGPHISKPGQGWYTRVVSAIGWGMLVLMGALWFSDLFSSIRIAGYEPIYTRAAAFMLIVAIFGVLLYYFIGRKQRSVDFLIATEGEMKKVNWSTRREIMGMTWVVIGLTVVLAAVLTVLDFLVFFPFFEWIRVIETS